MAGKIPFFITGANAKIKVNGITLAFCTDLQYTVTVKHAAPKVLGMYETFTLEPLSYDVTGSFSIIRYTKGLVNFVSGDGNATAFAKILKGGQTGSGTKQGESPDLVDNDGNGVGAWGPSSGVGKLLAQIGVPFSGEGRAYESFNPAKLQNSSMFDIEVFQAAGGVHEEGLFCKFRDCRISQADLTIGKKSPAVQTFRFQACYLDEDTFNALFSGTGQHLT